MADRHWTGCVRVYRDPPDLGNFATRRDLTMIDRSYPQLVLITLALALVVTVGVAAGTSSAAFGTYNTNWEGTSEIRAAADAAGTETTVGQNVSVYDRTAPPETVAVILAPDTAYEEDAGAVQSYVRAGGTLVVADDFGSGGNDVLGAVGATARINGTPLRDEQQAGPSPAFPRATVVETQTYTEEVDGLMLNHGSAIDPGTATPLVMSSEYSYFDTNRNEELDSDETLAERPVVTVESVGNGTVVTVSDPSIFINSMLERSDNRQFLQNIVGSHQRVLLDVSHQSALPPLVTVQLFLQRAGLAIFLIGGASVLALIAMAEPLEIRGRLQQWASRVRQTQRNETQPYVTEEDIATAIQARHPEWDEEHVERVTNRLMERRREQTND